MSIAWSLFALCLLGAEAPSAEITYDVRVVKLDGLDWRGEFFARLQPVANQSGTAVWTAGRETAAQIAALDPNTHKWPRVTSVSHAMVHASNRANRRVVSGVSRLADGPFDHATKVAYTPQYQEVREGCAFTLSGRKLDQGVLACVVLDDTHVTAVHHVNLVESMARKASCDLEAAGCCGEKAGTIASRIEIPEVAHASVAGEWLIPNEGALVVSLGVQTTSDADGKAVAVERLVLIEAWPATEQEVRQASVPYPAAGGFRPLPPSPPYILDNVRYIEPIPMPRIGQGPEPQPGDLTVPMPMPAVPSRSLPEALDADGTALPLPPLPQEHETPSSLPGSSEPFASPQGHNRQQEQPEPRALDSGSTRTGFAPQRTGVPPGTSTTLFRLPLGLSGGSINIHIEIQKSDK